MTPRIRAVSLPLLLSALVFFMVLPVHAGAATDTLAAAQDHESDETTTQGICGRDAGIQTMIIDALTYGGATPTCEEVTADDLATITSLYSHRAYVNSLQPGDLDGLTRLKSLRIRKPGLITELPNGFFADTPNLKELVLSYQNIRELPVGIFDDVPQLIVLDLYDNELTTLPDNVFEHTPNLFYLNLSGNKLTVIGKDTLDDVQALSTLYLGANQLTEIPEDLFNSHANLRKLELERNQITALSEDTFDGLSQLTELDLSGNELTTLPEDVFEGLSSLTTLEIYGNPITSVPADVFEGLTNLTRLSINLPNVSSDSFKDVQQVNNLSVIIGSRSISEDSFHELTNLERLDLFYGDLRALPADTFNGLTHLKHLNLSRNELTSLDEDIFDGLTGLEELKLSGNELTNLDEDIFDGLTSLEILALGDNKFNTLPANLFADLAQLKSLSITNSELQTLPVGAFNGLQAVEHINLAVNHLRSMPAGLFEGITKLRYLGMQQLQISTPVEPPTWAGEHGLDPDMFAIRTGDETLIFEVQPELVRGDQIVARIIQGAPFDVVVTLSAEGGTLSTDQVTIPAGSINSAPITVTPVSADEGQVTVTITSAIFEGWNTFEDPAGSCSCWGFRTGPGDDITVDVTFPTISGMPQVGQELTADTSGIADNDGLDNVSYSYQWLADDANIQGATDSTYTLADSDEGKAIQVKVSFTDDAGNEETLTSAATSLVGAESDIEPNVGYVTVVVQENNSDPDTPATDFTVTWNDPEECSDGYSAYISGWVGSVLDLGSTDSDGTQIAKTVPQSDLEGGMGYGVEVYCGVRDPSWYIASARVPEYGPSHFPVPGTYSSEPGLTGLTVTEGSLAPSFHQYRFLHTLEDVPSDAKRITLNATVKAGHSVVFLDHNVTVMGSCNGSECGFTYEEAGSDNKVEPLKDADEDLDGFQMDLADDQTHFSIHVPTVLGIGRVYRFSLSRLIPEPPTEPGGQDGNTQATGLPAISGTAQVGQSLVADTSGIDDADGLTSVSYSYQWIRSDGTTDTDIAGATGSTYTLVSADVGKAIKVEVSFTDDADHEETLTSAATAAEYVDGPPGAPRDVKVEAGDTKLQVSWQPPAAENKAPVEQYQIQYREEGGSNQELHTTRLSQQITDLTNGVTYEVQVTAKNAAGYGTPSDEMSDTPQAGNRCQTGHTAAVHRGGGVSP